VPEPHEPTPQQRARHIEALGLAIIVAIILITLVVRFGRPAVWSWRW